MIFRCKLCRRVKVWREGSCYKVAATNEENVITTIKICESCGDSIGRRYEEGRVIADMEIKETDE